MRQKAVTRVGGWVVSVMLSLCVGSVHFNPLVAVQVPRVRSSRYPPSSRSWISDRLSSKS